MQLRELGKTGLKITPLGLGFGGDFHARTGWAETYPPPQLS